MTGLGILLALSGGALVIAGQMWGLAPLALGLAVLIFADGDSEGGGA
jgi:hypothetical protein